MVSRVLVLVVEDDARAAGVLARMLRDDGYQVDVSHDGASAIGRLSRSPLPDVLVTDIRLPSGDGNTVARYAHAQCPEMPIVVVTGYPQLAQRLESAIRPPPYVFTKPLDYDALKNELTRMVGTAPPSRPA